MNIQGPTPNGIARVHGPHGINAPHAPFRNQPAQEAGATQPTGDRVEISAAAEAALNATETGEIRHELVNKIRAQIADGSYETPEKLDVALDRLLDEIG